MRDEKAVIYSDVNDTPVNSTDKVYDVQSVYSSLNNLFNTRRRERLFRPLEGLDIDELLFEPLNEDTAQSIFSLVIDSIARSEPRLELDMSKTDVVPDYDGNAYEVTIAFKLRGFKDEYEFKGAFERPTEATF